MWGRGHTELSFWEEQEGLRLVSISIPALISLLCSECETSELIEWKKAGLCPWTMLALSLLSSGVCAHYLTSLHLLFSLNYFKCGEYYRPSARDLQQDTEALPHGSRQRQILLLCCNNDIFPHREITLPFSPCSSMSMPLFKCAENTGLITAPPPLRATSH